MYILWLMPRINKGRSRVAGVNAGFTDFVVVRRNEFQQNCSTKRMIILYG